MADLKDFVPVASRLEEEEEGFGAAEDERTDAAAAAPSAEVAPPFFISFAAASAGALAPTVTPLSTLFVLACAVDRVDDSTS